MTQPKSDNLTAKEIAAHLGVHTNTVLKWGRDGLVPCDRIGHKHIRFNLAEVRAAMRKTK